MRRLEPTPKVTAGPFRSEQQVRGLPAVQEAYAAATVGRRGELARHGHKILCEALTAARVDAGEYDHRIVMWLAGFNDPKACAVIAGLITRASKAGRP